MKVLWPQDFPADGTEAFVLDVAGETLGAEDVSTHRGEEIEAFLLQVRLGLQADAASHANR